VIPRVTFIVAAYERVLPLWCQLASLACQTVPVEILVAENGQGEVVGIHAAAAGQFGGRVIMTRENDCYLAANKVWQEAQGEWLGFPNDDGYMVPTFAEMMIRAAEKNGWDLVYCDTVYDPRLQGSQYSVLAVEPRIGKIDKTSFLVRRRVWEGFTPHGGNWTLADGSTIEAMVKRGVAHGKAPGVLVFHN
jgi:hypothetical protein